MGRGPLLSPAPQPLPARLVMLVTQELQPRSITRLPQDGGASGPEGWGGEEAKDAGEMDPPGTSPRRA